MSMINLLRKYQEHVPVNVEGLIRELGVALDKKGDLGSDIAGQIEPLPDGSFKITVNKNDHYFRQRFTMAHELGHYLLHRDLIGSGVGDDRLYRSTASGSFYNSFIDREQETQANQFAANLLMPAAATIKVWAESVGDINVAAKKLLVSPAALRIRLDGLGSLQVRPATTEEAAHIPGRGAD